MGEPVAELENAVVAYAGSVALGPISLSVHENDFWGVVGPNGAGKTTLLEVLAGLRPLSQGERSARGAAGKAIGLLFQHHNYRPDLPLSVEDVVSFGRVGRRGLFRRFGPEDREAVEAAIERMGLTEIRGQPYRELSGGTRQKVQLARMVAQEADLLLLDEPTAGLDLDWQERLIQVIASLHGGTSRAVVMVTHDIDHLPECCNRVLLLKAGRPLAAGAPGDVLTSGTLSELYSCRMGVDRHEGRYHAFRLGAKEAG